MKNAVDFEGASSSKAIRARLQAYAPMPMTLAGRSGPRRLHAGPRHRLLQADVFSLRWVACRAFGSDLCPRGMPEGTSSRRRSARRTLLAFETAQTTHSQKRRPLTSLRATLQIQSPGRLGCSTCRRCGPTGSSMPRKSRTCATSPKGMPVCAMPHGPGFMPRNKCFDANPCILDRRSSSTAAEA